jgi:hypothetical protein
MAEPSTATVISRLPKILSSARSPDIESLD